MVFFTSASAALTAFLLFLLHLRVGGQIQFVDNDYVEFALNLEYLESEFFLYGALGKGLDDLYPDMSNGGPKPLGAQQANLKEPFIKSMIEQFGYQEVGHLRAIFNNTQGFARPLLNLSASLFSDIMNSAFGVTFDPPFDPYANDINYLLASYLIPYVGLTGYLGAVPNLQTSTFKKLVAGLLAVESGQDAAIRSLLFDFNSWNPRVLPYQFSIADFTNKMSALRDKLANDGTKDEGIVVDPRQGAEGRIAGNVLAGDAQSLGYDRTPEEILKIVYSTGNAAKPGGFFINGADGKIAKSFRY